MEKNKTVSILDKNNILWKCVDGELIGKRSVWTFCYTACWIEDTTQDNIKSYWAGGKDVNYKEVFKDYESPLTNLTIDGKE